MNQTQSLPSGSRQTPLILAIVGGKLQGVEAAYLAQKAGFHTLVIDKNPEAPASVLCDSFLTFEFTEKGLFPRVSPRPDLILPAIEDEKVLTLLETWANEENIPLAFDLNAYKITSSKIKSDALFKTLNLPAPVYWPACGFPLVVKPDNASGSEGVTIFRSPEEFQERFPDKNCLENLVIQEFLEGPSYSIEVVGRPGHYQALQVTDLGMDADHDCNRVQAPTDLSSDQVRSMKEMAVKIAGAVRLTGIMDLEVILNRGELKLLEIDARIPSQTPMTVYHSTGWNMVAMLAGLFLENRLPEPDPSNAERPARIEHIRLDKGQIHFQGEHIMALDGPLHLETDFFGADEAITSFSPEKGQWVATLVFTGDTAHNLERKRNSCMERIAGFRTGA